MPFQSTDPQLGPAMALVALRKEFPHLPAASWHVSTNGHLSGTVHDPAHFAAFAEVLGGTPMAPFDYELENSPRWGEQLFTTWRDVEVSLAGLYEVAAAPALKAVA
jgi:hypothetical protein